MLQRNSHWTIGDENKRVRFSSNCANLRVRKN